MAQVHSDPGQREMANFRRELASLRQELADFSDFIQGSWGSAIKAIAREQGQVALYLIQGLEALTARPEPKVDLSPVLERLEALLVAMPGEPDVDALAHQLGVVLQVEAETVAERVAGIVRSESRLDVDTLYQWFASALQAAPTADQVAGRVAELLPRPADPPTADEVAARLAELLPRPAEPPTAGEVAEAVRDELSGLPRPVTVQDVARLLAESVPSSADLAERVAMAVPRVGEEAMVLRVAELTAELGGELRRSAESGVHEVTSRLDRVGQRLGDVLDELSQHRQLLQLAIDQQTARQLTADEEGDRHTRAIADDARARDDSRAKFEHTTDRLQALFDKVLRELVAERDSRAAIADELRRIRETLDAGPPPRKTAPPRKAPAKGTAAKGRPATPSVKRVSKKVSPLESASPPPAKERSRRGPRAASSEAPG